ncbi:MAG: ATP-binding protein [Caulobacterales bacterium]
MHVLTGAERAARLELGQVIDLDSLRPTLARIARLAKDRFQAPDAGVVLISDTQVWLSAGPDPTWRNGNTISQRVVDTNEVVWIEDLRLDAEFETHPVVAGEPYLRFYAGVPIRMENGAAVGALRVVDVDTRPFDPALVAVLWDLADIVAHECDRALAVRQRQEAQAEAAARQRSLEALVECAPIALVMTDRDLRPIRCNPPWRSAVGLPDGDLGPKTLVELMPSLEQWWPFFESCLAGKGRRIDQVRIELPGGYRPWVRLEVTPWRDADGEVGGLLIMTHEITDLVKAMRRTERSERRLKMALEIADVHVWELDIKRRKLETAGAADTFFDKPLTAEALFADPMSQIHPDDRQAVMEVWRRQGAEGKHRPIEHRIQRADGKEVWASGALDVVCDDKGVPLRVIGAMQNITERKLAEVALVQAREAAETANRAKSTFLATMSHEIRTPLNGVLGMAQALAADNLSADQRERVAVIRESGEALLAILNDVLDLSKIEAGKLELDEAEFDLEEIARGSHSVFAALANKKGLTFSLSVEDDACGVYLGDPSRLRQILYNLISNALKFTETGEIGVAISRAGDQLQVDVSDTGVGIDPDQLAHLFGRFQQGDASTTRRFGGTGLGLAICRELAELMGGRIAVESAVSRGSRFTVSLPFPRLRGSAEAAPMAEPSAPAALALKVLAAEDNTVNQLVLKALLSQIGVEPLMVENGLQALQAWEADDWDLVLMDVQMPRMDGLAATRAIREREAASGRRRTPIIALTANAMAHQIEEYLAAGMDGHVAKPIEVGQLFAVLEKALDDADPAKAAA